MSSTLPPGATSRSARRRRASVWLEDQNEWSWDREDDAPLAPALDLMPADWVPSRPAGPAPRESGGRAAPPGRRAPSRQAPARARRAPVRTRRQRQPLPRWVGASALIACLLVLILTVLAVVGAISSAGTGHHRPGVRARPRRGAPVPPVPPVAVSGVSHDTAGSTLETITYPSRALGTTGAFQVVLPPGYPAAHTRYPVLYLLHGESAPAGTFLQIGMLSELEREESNGEIQPEIVVIVEAGTNAGLWRGPYGTYVLEIQQLVDRLLRTRATRSARAIVGYDTGGYGALDIALADLDRFSTAEAWSSPTAGLEARLTQTEDTISSLGLHAYLYGAASGPTQSATFASELNAVGGKAIGIGYAGTDGPDLWHHHLAYMLLWAGRQIDGTATDR
ncbi:MAG TPA: alpha/beta hydrolase-fold protein [Solirubrobacteraceae bacterium]|nr:alpha/beta hydrolase-fold protein [Solirubrobacteraceae bacterium]